MTIGVEAALSVIYSKQTVIQEMYRANLKKKKELRRTAAHALLSYPSFTQPPPD